MSMTNSTDRIEIITSVQRRRRPPVPGSRSLGPRAELINDLRTMMDRHENKFLTRIAHIVRCYTGKLNATQRRRAR